MNYLPTEAEFVHCTGVQVFYKYIATLDEFGKNFLTVGGCCIERERFLIGVELQEVVAGLVWVELKFFTGGIARAGTFDFDYVGTKPCQKLSTRRTGLNSSEVHDLDSLKRSVVHIFLNFGLRYVNYLLRTCGVI